ncbi:unnamed protein product [Knipowitschia caucasica]
MRIIFLLLVFVSVLRAADPRSCESSLDLSTNPSSLSEGRTLGLGDIHTRSLSPWTWRMSTVQTQIPSTLWEAECSSSVCLFPQDGTAQGGGATAGHGLGLSAVPIHQELLVLERHSGSNCFTASFRRVAVGCTCVRSAVGST